MTTTIIGHGYVGLVTACVFADLGNTVYVIGRNADKIKRLQKGDPLIYEPGLKELLEKNIKGKRIFFTTSYQNPISHSDVVFIAVGTPPQKTGEADLSSVMTVAEHIGKNLKKGYTVISCKSTVPIGTNRKIAALIEKVKPTSSTFDIASCPEFLREGSAITDTFKPDRLVIGSNSKKAIEKLLILHKSLAGKRVIVGLESAEIIKYASNSILATKISFANLVSFLCEKTGADVGEVLDGVGLDNRIGHVFFDAGIGYGGSCFPKDIKALVQTGESLSVDMSLLRAVEEINQNARTYFLKKIIDLKNKKHIGIWGLSFKPHTDDVRDAPSLYIINELLKREYKIKVYDPEAMDNIKRIFGDRLTYCKNPYDVVKNIHILTILTEWNEFKHIDLTKVKKCMKELYIIDGRNIYSPKDMLQLGFHYISVGRKKVPII
ncbi:MAG TPA: UDP-glucose/GDP-mannose dehydrogenase family protein [Patescibacteria group bacterium]|nr:UDP-glucose/GDP-mannose dehydrogenase family protein [Patescibacteria group bacterium]